MKLATVSVDGPSDREEVYGRDAVAAGSDHG
jgi:hypothetical protein